MEENQLLWYTSSTGGSLSNNSNSYSISNLTTNVTYWVSSYNSQGCESALPRYPIYAVMNPLPSVPTPGTNARCGAGAVTLTCNTGRERKFSTVVQCIVGRKYPCDKHELYDIQSKQYHHILYVRLQHYYRMRRKSCCSHGNGKCCPSQPPTAIGIHCGPGPVSITAVPGANGNTINWYNDYNGGIKLATGTTFVTPSLTTSTTYFISTDNTSVPCESTGGRYSGHCIY